MTDRIQRTLGANIRTARMALDLTQAQLADMLGVTQAAVSGWESGARQPGLTDLYSIAAALRTDVSELLPSTGMTRPAVRAALRAVVGELDHTDLATGLDEFLDAADAADGLPVLIRSRASTPNELADDVLHQMGTSNPPTDVSAVAAACGIPIILWSFPDALSGLVVETDNGAVIGINKHQHDHRKRFSISHELGHILLRHLGTFHVDLAEIEAGTPPDYNWRHERAANDFAAALLMPGALIREHAAKTPHPADLADVFNVSPVAMRFRLTNLGLR